MEPMQFEIKEISSDDFALTGFHKTAHGRMDVFTLHLGPDEYAELTTTLINFGH